MTRSIDESAPRPSGVLNIRTGKLITPPAPRPSDRGAEARTIQPMQPPAAPAARFAPLPPRAPMPQPVRAAAAQPATPSPSTVPSRLASVIKPKPVANGDDLKHDNRRWAHRRASAASGTISGDGIGDPLPCVIMDTSSTGARVKPHFARAARCQSIDDLPEKFTLMFTMDRMAVDCLVAWRRKGEVGLKFTSPARDVPKPARHVPAAKGKR